MYPHLSDFEKAAAIEAETKAGAKRRNNAALWQCIAELGGSLRPLLFMMRPAAKKEA